MFSGSVNNNLEKPKKPMYYLYRPKMIFFTIFSFCFGAIKFFTGQTEAANEIGMVAFIFFGLTFCLKKSE
jgi:hypothetical protein